MADLSRKLAANVTRVVGADKTTGNESAYGYVESRNGEIKSADVLSVAGNQAALSLPGTAATPIRCGAANLPNRKVIMIYNNSTHTIYWGVTSGVTVASGIPLAPQSFITLSMSDAVTVYGITANSQTANLRVVEA